jgi:hypothetical protein
MPPSSSKTGVPGRTANADTVVAPTLIGAPISAVCIAISEKGSDLMLGRSSAHD